MGITHQRLYLLVVDAHSFSGQCMLGVLTFRFTSEERGLDNPCLFLTSLIV